MCIPHRARLSTIECLRRIAQQTFTTEVCQILSVRSNMTLASLSTFAAESLKISFVAT